MTTGKFQYNMSLVETACLGSKQVEEKVFSCTMFLVSNCLGLR